MHRSAIALVSSNAQTLLSLGQQLKTFSDLGDIVTVHSPPDRLPHWSSPPRVLVLIDESPVTTVFQELSERYPNTAVILMTRTAPADLYLKAMQTGIEEVLVESDPPEKLYWVLKRLGEDLNTKHASHGKVMAFTSCKGGGGATFLATNLAYVLAEEYQKRILVIDLNLNFGDAALFVSDRAPTRHLGTLLRSDDWVQRPDLEAALTWITPRYALLAAPEYPGDHPHVGGEALGHLIRLARTQFDVVLMDVGRSFDQLALTAFDIADQIVPIFQNSMPNLRDGRRLVELFRALGYADDKVFPVLNRYERNAEIRASHLETAFGRKLLHTVPTHPEAVVAAMNQGVPIHKIAPTSPVSKSLLHWAASILGAKREVSRSWMSRVLH